MPVAWLLLLYDNREMLQRHTPLASSITLKCGQDKSWENRFPSDSPMLEANAKWSFKVKSITSVCQLSAHITRATGWGAFQWGCMKWTFWWIIIIIIIILFASKCQNPDYDPVRISTRNLERSSNVQVHVNSTAYTLFQGQEKHVLQNQEVVKTPKATTDRPNQNQRGIQEERQKALIESPQWNILIRQKYFIRGLSMWFTGLCLATASTLTFLFCGFSEQIDRILFLLQIQNPSIPVYLVIT